MINLQKLSVKEKFVYSLEFFEEIFFFFFCFSLSFFLIYSRKNLHIILFFLSISIVSLCQVYLIFFDYLDFIYLIFLFFISFLILNLCFLLLNKEVSKWFIFLEFIISIIIFLTSWKTHNDTSLFFQDTIIISLNLVFLSIFLYTVSLFSNILFDTFEKDILKKIIALISFLFPIFVLYVVLNKNIDISILYFRKIVFLSFLFFTILFLCSSYNYTYIYTKFSFKNIFIAPIFLFFIFFNYLMIEIIIIIGLQEVFHLIINFISILFYIFFSQEILQYIEKLVYSILSYFNHSLKKIPQNLVEISNSSISIEDKVKQMNYKIKDYLHSKKISILTIEEEFKEINSSLFIKIKKNSEIWDILSQKVEMLFVKDLENINNSIIKNIYEFFKQHNIFMAYPLFNDNFLTTIGFLVVIEEKGKSFSIIKIFFLRKISKIIERTLVSYQIGKKRETSYETKNYLKESLKFNPDRLNHLKNDYIEIDFMNKPSIIISGDYLKILLKKEYLYFFIGDISGHGLSTSYLKESLKAIFDFHTKSEFSITFLFDHINDFFLQRYNGNDFLTLIGGCYDFNKRELNFINAGHLPIIHIQKDKKLKQVTKSQTVIGVLKNKYFLEKMELSVGDKIFIYTDGITETLNSKEQQFGEENLLKFLEKNSLLSPKKLIKNLKRTLFIFRQTKTLQDDNSAICIHIKK